MGRMIYSHRKFKPMPQTQKEDFGHTYRVMWRIYNPATLKDNDRWQPIAMPKTMSPTYKEAVNLTKPEAHAVKEYWLRQPGIGCFEIQVIPMEIK